MKNKGFTLIELLAVILILAIVALIAVPLVTNVINESKEKAAKVTAQVYVRTIEDKIAKDKLLGRNGFVSGKTYLIKEDTVLIDLEHGNISQVDGETVLDIDNSFYLKDVIKVKGNAPTDGYIVYENGKIVEVAFIIDGLLVTGTADQIRNGDYDVNKFNGPSNISDIVLNTKKDGLLGGETFKLTALVTTTDGEEPNRNTRYSSSNTSVATVSSNGTITAVNEGTTQITAKAGNKKTTYVLTVYNGSLLGFVGTIEETGLYQTTINNVIYNLNVIVLDGNQTITSNTTYGSLDDCASGTGANQTAKRMVVVKVKGNYTVNSGVTVGPVYNEYGGPKGFMLYVTGKLINNGTIDNSHGAYADGQDVYLYRNSDNTYEYIPATGATGGEGVSSPSGYCSSISGSGKKGNDGISANIRATGGGGSGSGKTSCARFISENGGTGTSYSGGVGSGYANACINSSGVSNKGGSGGASCKGDAGTGNPSGGTGGLLIIYADEYQNNGLIRANGASSSTNSGSSGGGSINIFTNQRTNITQLGVVTDDKYAEMLGNTEVLGGQDSSGKGGNGTVNIGETRNGKYYDLKQIIEQDKQAYGNNVVVQGDSIISILQNNNLRSGYYLFKVNNEQYPVHLYTFDGNQNWNGKVIGDALDCATGSTSNKMAQNMVIAKVNGNLTNTGLIEPYYNQIYGGPKGFMLYVTGTLTNSGTIDNSHGAYADGQDVYLYKNANNTYEYVPAIGATGGSEILSPGGYCSVIGATGNTGNAGSTVSTRALAGGGSGSGGTSCAQFHVKAGGNATSYSGGVGSGYAHACKTGSLASNIGGAAGTGCIQVGNEVIRDGTGNPSGGTGGLLIIYANSYNNLGIVSANGAMIDEKAGGSGGGSVNVFYRSLINQGTATANGGSGSGDGGSGGTGSISHTQIN